MNTYTLFPAFLPSFSKILHKECRKAGKDSGEF
jgi:hypothetical protein